LVLFANSKNIRYVGEKSEQNAIHLSCSQLPKLLAARLQNTINSSGGGDFRKDPIWWRVGKVKNFSNTANLTSNGLYCLQKVRVGAEKAFEILWRVWRGCGGGRTLCWVVQSDGGDAITPESFETN
jgi:hypothetical protein